MEAPSGEYVAVTMEPPPSASLWPASVKRHSPVAASQTVADLCPEAVTMEAPSGEYAAEMTINLLAAMVKRHTPVAASQTLADPSAEAVTMEAPSREYAAEKTAASWPASVRQHSPVAASLTSAPLPCVVTMKDRCDRTRSITAFSSIPKLVNNA